MKAPPRAACRSRSAGACRCAAWSWGTRLEHITTSTLGRRARPSGSLAARRPRVGLGRGAPRGAGGGGRTTPPRSRCWPRSWPPGARWRLLGNGPYLGDRLSQVFWAHVAPTASPMPPAPVGSLASIYRQASGSSGPRPSNRLTVFTRASVSPRRCSGQARLRAAEPGRANPSLRRGHSSGTCGCSHALLQGR